MIEKIKEIENMAWGIKQHNIFEPSTFFHHPFMSEEHIKEKYQKTPALPEWESVAPINYLQVSYLTEIESLYNSTRLLYALSPEVIPFFHFQVLSASRTILELLIRFQQNIRDDVKLDPIGPRFDEVTWDPKIREQARTLYGELSLATHGRHNDVYNKSLSYRLCQNDLTVVEKKHLSTLIENLGEDQGKRVFSAYNGPILDKFCFEVIGKINIIIIEVMKENHYDSKPNLIEPQHSKPK